MATGETQQTNRLPPLPEQPTTRERTEEVSAGILAGGTLVEAIAGLVAIVLSIIGLAGIWPVILLGIATIVIGVALLFEGGAIAVRFARFVPEADRLGSRMPQVSIGRGMGVEVAGGIAGIILGILALIGLFPMVLTSVSAIVFGATFLLSGGTGMRLNNWTAENYHWSDMSFQVAREAVAAASGVQLLTGMAGVILGILAVCLVSPLILTLVAMLSLGCGILLNGAAISGKMLTLMQD